MFRKCYILRMHSFHFRHQYNAGESLVLFRHEPSSVCHALDIDIEIQHKHHTNSSLENGHIMKEKLMEPLSLKYRFTYKASLCLMVVNNL